MKDDENTNKENKHGGSNLGLKRGNTAHSEKSFSSEAKAMDDDNLAKM